MHLEEILIPISAFAMVFGVAYIFFTTRHKERLALIEKGADAKMFYANRKGNNALKFGMLAVGIGLGIVFGQLLMRAELMGDEAIPAMMFLCGGSGLILFYFIDRKINNRADSN